LLKAVLKPVRPGSIPTGVVGLGLMGTSVVACLLGAGHLVVAVTRSLAKHRNTKRHVLALLREMSKEGLLKSDPAQIIQQLSISEDYGRLADREIVVESIIESLETKRQVLRRVEEAVSPKTIIGSNTSAIPIPMGLWYCSGTIGILPCSPTL
jgi:3-hydroxybutyryl-CoA dehydrogenase